MKSRPTYYSFWLFLVCLWWAEPGQAKAYFQWQELAPLPPVGQQTEALGVAGPFVGVHHDALIIAGGANFGKPYWDSHKVWHRDIWVLVRNGSDHQWVKGGELAGPMAYGASVSTAYGVLCLGGNNAENTLDSVFLLQWDPAQKTISTKELPHLPSSCAYGSACMVGNTVYLAGGTKSHQLNSALTNFWSLDLSRLPGGDLRWQVLPPWPGPARAFNLTATQHNGQADCVYVLSGRCEDTQGSIHFLRDVYEYNPSLDCTLSKESPWRKREHSPVCLMAGTAIAVGQSHVFVMGGADGSHFFQADDLRERHPGFPKRAWAYHTITNTWIEAGTVPQNQVTTQPAAWGDAFIIASGEVRPRVRTPQVWKLTTIRTARSFGWFDYATIAVYLLTLIGIGLFFSTRNKSTEDFFRGGQRVPWWAAGCSIFATMLSSITFMAIPSKTYAANWRYFLINMTIVALAPFIIYGILPFFRKLDATSAYEYLERRFSYAARMIGSVAYILLQGGKMAIVMFLPALALSTVTPVSVEVCILLMGTMSIIYCVLGGVEAVVWTDTLQTVVLLGGALLSFVLIVLNLDGGLTSLMSTGLADQKFNLVHWDWSVTSYTTTALWVIVVGGLAQQFVPYASDQGVVQRYMSVSSEKKAANAIWTNAGLSFVGSVLFFVLGTALYVFYKQSPQELDPTLQNDSIFAQFIASQLPVGLAGLVIAAVFAAAQSTISTMMNSIATAVTTDFVRRFSLLQTERAYLRLARVLTVVTGLFGTAVALWFARSDSKNMWDSFMKVIGLFGGPTGALFLLGIFTKRAHSTGVVLGALGGVALVAVVQWCTNTSFVLFTAIGMTGCVLFGYGFSLVLPNPSKEIEGLTIYTSR